MRFPRIIHQIWMQGEAEMPDFAKHSMKTWKEKNPGFEYMFWDEEAIEELIKQDYPWFYQSWKTFPHMIQRVDTGRYAILHKYGGIACDMDSNCLNSVEPLMAKFDDTDKTVLVASFPYQNPIEHIVQQSLNFDRELINNGIQVAKPGNEIHMALLRTANKRAQKVQEGILKPSSKMEEVAQVGGLAMATNVMQYDEYRDQLEILPYYSFEAQEAPKKIVEKGEGVYSEHKWKASWAPVWMQKVMEATGPRGPKYALAGAIPLFLLVLFFLVKRLLGDTVASVFMIGLILLFMTVFSLSSHGAYVSDHKTTNGPLNDRFFDLIPHLQKSHDSWEYLLIYQFPTFLFASTLIYALYFHKGGDKKLFVTILCSFLILHAIRQFTVQLTGLPPPVDLHNQQLQSTSVQESFKKRDTEEYVPGRSDMIFSGHTITTLLSLLFIFYMFGKLDSFKYRILIGLLMTIAVCLFTWIRLHYSVDMFLAIAICLLVFGYARHFYEDADYSGLQGSRFFTILKVAVGGAFLSIFVTLISLQVKGADCTDDIHCARGSVCLEGKCKVE